MTVEWIYENKMTESHIQQKKTIHYKITNEQQQQQI